MRKDIDKVFKISLLVLIIPFIISAIFYNQLPDVIPTHFDINGNPDGYSSKLIGLFGTNTFMVLMQVFLYFMSTRVPRYEYQGKKPLTMVLFIIPVLSIILTLITIIYALGYNIAITQIIMILIGFMFVVIGNYLPKTKRNYTLGIKLPWTIDNDEVWNATHRLGGKVWFVSGVFLVISGIFLPTPLNSYVMIALMIITVLIPSVYSYIYYKRITRDTIE